MRLAPSLKTNVADLILPSLQDSAMSPMATPVTIIPAMSGGSSKPLAARLSRPMTALNCIGSFTRPSMGTRPMMLVMAVTPARVAFSGIVKKGMSSLRR